MSVHKVKRSGRDGWQVRYRDHSGKARKENYDVKTDAEARDVAIRQAKQRKEPIPQRGRGGNGVTFERFALDQWWPDDVVGRRLAPKTQTWYAELLDRHLIPRVGDEAVAFIDATRAIGLRSELAADGVPDYTAARALKLFRQVLAHAVVKGLLPFNPADVLRGKGALPAQGRTKDIWPMPPEATEALRATILASRSPHRDRDAALVSVLAYAGLRPEEALALPWGNVKATTLRVEHANSLGEIRRTKTGDRRTVPVIPTLAADLKAWRKLCGNPADDVLVFPNAAGGPFTLTEYENWRRRAFRKNLPASAKDKGATPYSLRHGYASLLSREGLDLATIARQMGNSPTTTAQHYTHVFEEYDGQPVVPMATAVKRARARGHNKGTLSRATTEHAAKQKGQNGSKQATSGRKRVPSLTP